MNQYKIMPLLPSRTGRLSVLTLTSLFCTLFALLITSSVALAEGTPGGNVNNAIVKAVDVAKPSVVRIITDVPGRLTVHLTANDTQVFPRDGSSYQLDISGSGAFISSHGDIVTADHVVHPPQADMTDYIYQVAAQDIADYVNNTYAPTPPYDANQIYYSLTTGSFRSEPHYDAPKSQVYLSTDYTGTLNAKTLKGVDKNFTAPIDTIKRESNPDAQDLAVIHVAMDDTPSISLGDSTSISQQDELTVIGFPGNADITQKRDPTQLLTSSVNKIYVSAIKQSDDGTPLIQVSGNVEHGDSGGPALDSHGNIVGIVSFQKDSNGQPNNTSFLHVSQNIQQMIDALKLDTAPGKLQLRWQQAFNNYTATTTGHWHKASTMFAKLASDYPTFTALKPFADYTALQAKQERLPQPKPKETTPSFLPYLLPGFAVIVLLIIGIVVFLMQKKKSRPATQPGFQSQTANGNQPYPSSFGYPSGPTQPTPSPWGQPTPVLTPSPWGQPVPVPTTPWNSPTTPPQTPAYIGNGMSEVKPENPYRQSSASSFNREQTPSWPPSNSLSPSFPAPGSNQNPNPNSNSKNSGSGVEEITGKHAAIQKSQINQPISEPVPERKELGEKTIQQAEPTIKQTAGNGAPAFTPYSSPAPGWPAPTTWQQAGVLSAQNKKGATAETPQIDFGNGSDFNFSEFSGKKQP